MHSHIWFTVISFHSMAAYIPLSAILLYWKPALWPYLFSMFSGLMIAFFDIGAAEVQVPALLLIAFGFFTGYASPGRAWRWGLLTGIWVPAFHIVRMMMRNAPGDLLPAEWGSVLALAFAMGGAYGGSLLGAAAGVRSRGEHSSLRGSTTVEGDKRRTP